MLRLKYKMVACGLLLVVACSSSAFAASSTLGDERAQLVQMCDKGKEHCDCKKDGKECKHGDKECKHEDKK